MFQAFPTQQVKKKKNNNPKIYLFVKIALAECYRKCWGAAREFSKEFSSILPELQKFWQQYKDYVTQCFMIRKEVKIFFFFFFWSDQNVV